MVQIIGAENLEKQYGSIEAVAGINFSIEKGDFFGFLGPNGAVNPFCISDAWASFGLFYSSVVFVDYRYNYYDCISGAASGQNDEKTDHEIA